MKNSNVIDSEDSVEELNYGQAESLVRNLDDKPELLDFFEAVANDPASRMCCIVATKTVLPISTLEKLADDSHCNVARQVSQNKSALKAFSADLLIQMMNRDLGVAFRLVDNLSLIKDDDTRNSVIHFMIKTGDPEIIEKLDQYHHSLTVNPDGISQC